LPLRKGRDPDAMLAHGYRGSLYSIKVAEMLKPVQPTAGLVQQ
jgi:hypothetical protein